MHALYCYVRVRVKRLILLELLSIRFVLLQVNVEGLGAIVKIRVRDSMKQHHRMWSIQEITLKDVDTKEVLIFNFAAHVGLNLITEETIDFNNREFENKLNLKDNEIESYALRHDKPVMPSKYQVDHNLYQFVKDYMFFAFWLIWYSTKRACVIMICPSCIVVSVISIVGIYAQPS